MDSLSGSLSASVWDLKVVPCPQQEAHRAPVSDLPSEDTASGRQMSHFAFASTRKSVGSGIRACF